MTTRTMVRETAANARRRPLALVAALVATFLATVPVPAFAQENEPAPPALSDAERVQILGRIEAVGRRGFLYEVARPARDGSVGKRLFLYGTIHVGRAGSEPFNAPLMDALRRSRRLELEADPTDLVAAQRIALELGQYGPGDDLRRHLPPALMARVQAFGEKNGLPSERVGRFKPWLLANMITVKQISGSGLDADLGSELYLAGFAQGVRLPIVEIEGMEAQLRWLAGLPDALQAAQLDEALDEVDDDARNDARTLFEVWLAGDAAAADALVADMHRDSVGKVFEQYFVDTLIDGRNRSMADRAERYLEQPGSTFFAVGCLHLFGDTGLLREFARRGYRVVDLQAATTASR